MTTGVGSGSASTSTSTASASTSSPTPPSPSRTAAEAHPAAPWSTHHTRPAAPPISTVPNSQDLHDSSSANDHGVTGSDSADTGTRDNSPLSKMPTTDSVPGMGSFASHGTSNYLRTPTTPIMTQCFVDSPADARLTGFPTFQAFTAPPSSLSTALHPNSAYTASPSTERDLGKKRPHPLELDTGRTGSGEYDGPLTSMSTGSARSTLSNELEHLRRSVHQNLRERPIDISVDDSDSEFGEPDVAQDTTDRAIDAREAFQLLRSSPQLLFVDTRPLDDFLRAHLARAAHVNIPSLIYNRLRRQLTGSHHEDTAATWASLGSFVSTSSGRSLWDGVDLASHLDVIVVGTSSANGDPSQKLATVLTHLVTHGSVRVLQGGWGEAAPLAESEGLVVTGESKEGGRTDLTPVALPTASPAVPGSGASTPSALALSPPEAPPVTLEQGGAPAPSQIVSRDNSSSSSGSSTSGPSMSPMRRSLPQLSLNVGSAAVQQPQVPQPMTEQQPRRPPKLSLQVDPSNTLPLPIQRKAQSARTRPKPGGLTIDVGDSNRLHVPAGLKSAMPSRSGHSGLTPDRRYSGSTSAGFVSRPDEPWSRDNRHGAPPSPLPLPAGEPYSTSTSFSSAGVTPVGKPIEVSTILPSFLYLGPEIATRADVDTLLALGIRRILNVAVECDDDEGLGLRTSFERYYRIPMKDAVEESGVSKGIRDSCNILDDARLHDAPVYVHCKAGKSRSVTVVLAYLIHANAWTLKTSYAYVAERRHGISPNIGFVAELIQFEETELGNKQKEDSEESERGPQIPTVVPHPKPGLRYTRESLPPQWGSDTPSASAPASSLGGPIVSEPEHTPENTATRRQKQSAADIEVRKNGQWVHGRRAPVDRTTLQPGRRVSKAGLESMTMRPLEPTPSRSPEP